MLTQQIIHDRKRVVCFRLIGWDINVLSLTHDADVVREKWRDELTIFLDFILTKYFRKRGVNEC